MSDARSNYTISNPKPIFEFSDATFMKEFPGVIKCSVRCVNGINANEDLPGSEKIKNIPGMCYLYKGSNGHFIVMFTTNKIMIVTQQGIYNNFQTFHSIRCNSNLFVFEEDFSLYEEANCVVWDTKYWSYKLKEYVALSKLMSIFDSSERTDLDDSDSENQF